MKKRAILLIGLLTLALFAMSISAYTTSGGKHNFNVELHKGWNLMPEAAIDYAKTNDAAIPASTMNILSKTANWGKGRHIYLAHQNKYVTIGLSDNEAAMQQVYSAAQEGYVHFTPSWVYFKEDTVIDLPFYTALIEEYDNEWKMKMYKGWNLISITPLFAEGDITEGNCNIEKIYAWIAAEQKWQLLPNDAIFGDDDAVGYGVAMKVSSTCKLGKSTEESANGVPALPN